MPEVLFEMQFIGRVVRLTAIDPMTGIEVVSVGDARRGVEALKHMAARKLMYVLKRRAKESCRNAKGETA